MEKKIPFGKFKGRKLKTLPEYYLKWLSEQTGELEEWAKLAKEFIEDRSLEEAATNLLKSKGYDANGWKYTKRKSKARSRRKKPYRR